MQYVSFSAWLILFTIMSSRFIRVAMNGRVYFSWPNSIPLSDFRWGREHCRLEPWGQWFEAVGTGAGEAGWVWIVTLIQKRERASGEAMPEEGRAGFVVMSRPAGAQGVMGQRNF